MSWVKLDDGILGNPKITRVGPIGFALHVAAIVYCARNLTDGFVPYGQARHLLGVQWTEDTDSGIRIQSLAMTSGMAGSDGLEVVEHMIKLLCTVGLWERVEHGYMVHDYLVYNPSREQVLAEREANREQRSNAGKRSAQVRRERFGTAQPKRDSERAPERPSERAVRGNPERSSERRPEQDIERSPNPVPVPVALAPQASLRVKARARRCRPAKKLIRR